jgi:hypothetical protein
MVEKFDVGRFRHYWPSIEAELDTIPHTWAHRWTKETIFDCVVDGRFQCWAVGSANEIRAMALSQIVNYPAANVFQVLLLFGRDFFVMLDNLQAAMEKFAAFNGCGVIEVIGREGWEPKLRKIGFRKTGVVLEKELGKIVVN